MTPIDHYCKQHENIIQGLLTNKFAHPDSLAFTFNKLQHMHLLKSRSKTKDAYEQLG